MKTLIFEGGSDDIFSEVTNGLEMCNDADCSAMQFRVSIEGGIGVLVTGCYCSRVQGGLSLGDGCWMIGFESMDEERPCDWPMRIFPSHRKYCNRLEIDAPDNALVEALA